MSHWAEIDENNIVIRVLVGNDDEPDEGYSWLTENLGGDWLKCSYNTVKGIHYDPETNKPSKDQNKAFRGNYPTKGFYYDGVLDAFIPPKPFPSWVFDKKTYGWQAPVPEPIPEEEGLFDFIWDESSLSWNVVKILDD
jgi:hypothetical protein